MNTLPSFGPESDICAVLQNPLHLQILSLLVESPRLTGDLEAMTAIGRDSLFIYLKRLKEAGLVDSAKVYSGKRGGQPVEYFITPHKRRALARVITELRQLANLFRTVTTSAPVDGEAVVVQ